MGFASNMLYLYGMLQKGGRSDSERFLDDFPDIILGDNTSTDIKGGTRVESKGGKKSKGKAVPLFSNSHFRKG